MPSHSGHLHIKLHPPEAEAIDYIMAREKVVNPTTAPRSYAELIRRLLIEKAAEHREIELEGV